jgi:ribonuclease HI
MADGCIASGAGGTMHLAWGCKEAQCLWESYASKWAESRAALMRDILGLKMTLLPEWLVEWGQQEQHELWEEIHAVAREMWRLGIAAVLTAIWRRNVDRRHPDGRRLRSLEEEIATCMAGVAENYVRYRQGKLPVTADSWIALRTADAVRKKWGAQTIETGIAGAKRLSERIGFFDGGSRGNPGPGGSGSVFVERDTETEEVKIIWAAATALGCPTMTNNVAEFVGLHRLLAYAAEKGWTGVHVVGDSAMILNLMKNRTPPKAKKLKQWYALARRLADICQVASWSHHYRANNKMADWLANEVMNTKRSVMRSFEAAEHSDRLKRGVQTHMEVDIRQWADAHKTREGTTGVGGE